MHKTLIAFLALGCFFCGACGEIQADNPTNPYPSDNQNCNGVDLQTDNKNCGKCGNACNNNQTCEAGVCKTTCTGDDCSTNKPNQCDGVDLQNSRMNCGTCGRVCKSDQMCESGICVTCSKDATFCGEKCYNLTTDSNNCGECDKACGENQICKNSACACKDGFSDCNNDGICETHGECAHECELGETMPCYYAHERTLNVGECKAGVLSCIENEDGIRVFDGVCVGAVLPVYALQCDLSNPNLDANCNGIPDAQEDQDKDGYRICPFNGQPSDCCDSTYNCTSRTNSPELVHPQAYDCYGNNIDDDCDGEIDEDTNVICGQSIIVDKSCEIPAPDCSTTLDYQQGGENSTVSADKAYHFAKAIDMCMPKVTLASGNPGIIEYSLTPSGVSGLVFSNQVNIVSAMKDRKGEVTISPRAGKTFVMLSSGFAKDPASGLPAQDKAWKTEGAIPEPYNSAHKSTLQSHSSCSQSANPTIKDSVRLHIRLRAPENAKGFRFDFRFFSREYPKYVCSKYNDFFLALLTDETGKPIVDINNDGKLTDEDGNISFDAKGNPISVNNAFFTSCATPACKGGFESANATGCPAILECIDGYCGTCVDGSDAVKAYSVKPYLGGNVGDEDKGGGTAWLTTKAPITPGSVFNLDFHIWDTGDEVYDSTVLLDNFQWLCTETTVSTGFASAEDEVILN